MKQLTLYLGIFFLFGAEILGAAPRTTLLITPDSTTAIAGSKLLLHAKIKNGGPDDLKMVTCSCAIWESWTVKGEGVAIPAGACEKNVCAPETFPAHGEVEKKIEVVIGEKALAGPLTFQLRFGEPALVRGSLQRTLLSNSITIEIKKT